AQIDHDATTNYAANEHFTQASITTVGTVTSGNVTAILPTGTVSSSTQITITESQISDLNHYDNTDNLTYLNSLGVFSASAQVNANTITNFDSNVLTYINSRGVFSASAQVNANTITNFDSNVLTYINSRAVVSASAQIDHDQTTNFAASEHFTQANITTVGTVTAGSVTAILPTGTVSSSAFSSPSQGTVRATINGATTDVDTGLQTSDSPTFTGLTVATTGTPDVSVGSTSTSSQDAIFRIRGSRTTSTTSDIAQLYFETNDSSAGAPQMALITARKETSSTNVSQLRFSTTATDASQPSLGMTLRASGDLELVNALTGSSTTTWRVRLPVGTDLYT
ncbi:MAG: hypothetical protein VW683_01630, partial [Betaproteobacteria bacterium]